MTEATEGPAGDDEPYVAIRAAEEAIVRDRESMLRVAKQMLEEAETWVDTALKIGDEELFMYWSKLIPFRRRGIDDAEHGLAMAQLGRDVDGTPWADKWDPT